ncbi:MAG: HEPN domain-containing protein [Pleurocapsa sp. SU_196_0]|nr:HEPN domain-containing protein [Pleurocapsa sp. SU_196_0]
MADSLDWQRWVSRAEMYFIRAEEDVERFPPSVCVDLQFACELYLKAVILFQGGIPERTHHLNELLNLIHPRLPDKARERLAGDLLVEVGFKQRYPGEFEDANTEEASAMLEAARLIRAYALGLLPIQETS